MLSNNSFFSCVSSTVNGLVYNNNARIVNNCQVSFVNETSLPQQMFSDALDLYNQFLRCNSTNIAAITTSQTITPGVYCTPNITLGNPFTLSFDALGNSSSIFVVIVSSNMALRNMALVNNAQPCNIFFVVEGSVSITGNINSVYGIYIANGEINIISHSLFGKLISLTNNVIVNLNTITRCACVSSWFLY